MCNPAVFFVASMALTAYSGYQQSKAQREAGKAQGAYYDAMARNKELEAEYAMTIGKKQSEIVQDNSMMQGKSLKKKQAIHNASNRARMASMGLTGVSAEDVVISDYDEQRIDEWQLRHNADMKSWSIMTDAGYGRWSSLNEANQMSYAGDNARYTGSVNARNTMLGTATSMAKTGMSFGMAGGFKSLPTKGLTGWLSGK